MRFTKSTLVVLSLALATTAFSVLTFGKKAGSISDKGAVATVTQMENDSVKADTAGDTSYVERNYADNFSGGSSWGNWETKQSILADMDTFVRQDGLWKQVASHSSQLAK